MRSFILLAELCFSHLAGKQLSLLCIQVRIRDALFVAKQLIFLSNSFYKFIAGVFWLRKVYLGQRNETGHLRFFFPQQLKHINKKMHILFCCFFFFP